MTRSEILLRWPHAVASPAFLDALDAAGYRVGRVGGRERTEVRWETQDGALRAAGLALASRPDEGRRVPSEPSP